MNRRVPELEGKADDQKVRRGSGNQVSCKEGEQKNRHEEPAKGRA